MAANTQQTAANTYIPFHWSPFESVSQIIQYYGATSIHLWQRRQYLATLIMKIAPFISFPQVACVALYWTLM